MPKKLTFEYVYDYIKSKGYELISKEYIENKTLLELKCRDCNEIYQQTFDRFSRGYHHPNCKNIDKISHKKDKIVRKCYICHNEFQPKRSSTMMCSKECFKMLWKTEEYQEKAKKMEKLREEYLLQNNLGEARTKSTFQNYV